MTIAELRKKYYKEVDALDLELIIARVLKKSREFVLAHPEFVLTKNQELKTKNLLARRIKHEPIAYILGKKEFFGLDFRVNKDVLVPRPETELLIELALEELRTENQGPKTAIDVGTGSGNIIVSLACSIKHEACNKLDYLASDISTKALAAAKQNAKLHKVDKKIKFLRGNLLEPFMKHLEKDKPKSIDLIILANLPYLSKKIYDATDVRKYEPKEALYSKNDGLAHYEKLLKQIESLITNYKLLVTAFLEISPEQKTKLQKIIRLNLPDAKVSFLKDLAGKWRVCRISL